MPCKLFIGMKDYEILLYLKNYKDENGKRVFRPSRDIKQYTLEDGAVIGVPASLYRNKSITKDSKEIIEIRAADHGTALKLWNAITHPEPWNNYYNLDIEFLNNPTPQNDLDGNEKFFVVDQWIYNNATITKEDLNQIVLTILGLGDNYYTDPTGKAVHHYVLTPNDKNGKDITDRSNVHQHQLDLLKKREEEKTSKEHGNNNTNESKRSMRITESTLRKIIRESLIAVIYD